MSEFETFYAEVLGKRRHEISKEELMLFFRKLGNSPTENEIESILMYLREGRPKVVCQYVLLIIIAKPE